MNFIGDSELLFEGRNTFIYLKKETSDSPPVVIKVLKEDYPAPRYIQQFNNEYNITHQLDIVGIRKVIEQKQLDTGHYTLLLKYIEGVTLKQFAQQKTISIQAFLRVALQIVKTIGQLHDQNIIHKDINSNNIIIEPNSLKATIIDFGISTKIDLKTSYTSNPQSLEGTLSYISPEQTGRMNRRIDYRTDLYSLGVTFYELLTGKLPFLHADPIKLIHQHLALTPNPPHFIRIDIPYQISEIILKLLAKNAESRYQSAFGLQKDLEKCLLQLQKDGTIESFPLASSDLPNKFNIPEKLYSRETFVEQLIEAFHFVNEGNSSLVLISGNAGVGKTALVSQLHEPITGKEAIFVTGKFDKSQNSKPYLGFIQVIEEYIEQLLVEDEMTIEKQKKKILRAIGEMGQILLHFIPKLKLIIDEPTEALTMVNKETQNLLHFVFYNFIKIIAQKEHPLVIFLDDLQWADKSSLKLLEQLSSQEKIPYLLMIGAYRTEKLHNSHFAALQNIKENAPHIKEIKLTPLKIEAVQQFIADALYTTTKECQTLAELVWSKTNGNPFFMIQFLKSLYEEGLLRFKLVPPNLQSKENILYKWEWNMSAIRQRNITDNVVRLLAERVKKLLPETQRVLQFAACIGNRFDLELLSLAYEHSLDETTKALQEAFEEGLVIPTDENLLYSENVYESKNIEYKFTHNQIRKAIYAFIPNLYKKNIHWKIGHLLQERNTKTPQPQQIFEIVQQLNKAIDTIEDTQKRIELVELNMQAGEKSKASIAFDLAYQYFDTAVSLLPDNSWKKHYDLTLSLHNQKAEVAYLSGKMEDAESILNEILENTQTTLDNAMAWRIKLLVHKAKGEIHETILAGIKALKNLGLHISVKEKKYVAFWEIIKTDYLLKKHLPNKIEALPTMTDPKQLVIIDILHQLMPASYLYGHNLFPMIICKLIALSLKHGINSYLPLALLTYASLCINFRKQIKKGYNYGEMALSLSDKLEGENNRVKVVSIFHSFVYYWQNPLHRSLPKLIESYNRFLALGDFEFAGISIATYISYGFFSDRNLINLRKKAINYYEVVKFLQVMNPIHRIQIFLQVIHNLSNVTDNPTTLAGDFFDEKSTVALLKANKSHFALFVYNSIKIQLFYLFGNYKKAYEFAQEFDVYQTAGTNSMFSYYVFCTYNALAHLAAYPEISKKEQREALQNVKTWQNKLKIWKNHDPDNHAHRWHLIEAEYFRIIQKPKKAIKHYRKAISLSEQNGFISFEALGNELLGKYYLKQNDEDFAEFYLQKALMNYRQWGALTKAEQLVNDYPQQLAHTVYSSTTARSYSLSSWSRQSNESTGGQSQSVNAADLVQISQDLLGEIEYSKLLEKLMIHSLDHTGAQIGYLMLVNEKRISVEAKSKTYSLNEEYKEIEIIPSIPLKKWEKGIAHVIINYVMRTQQPLLLDNAQKDERFKKDTYIIQNEILSVFCLPILKNEKIIGLIYLENNLTTNAFSRERLRLMKVLSTQIAIALENTQLYQALLLRAEGEQSISNRLLEKNKDLQQFTYITSHNLREPVSNLLGLLELYNKENLEDPINQIVLDGFHEVAHNMDNMLRDLNRVIAAKKKAEPPREQVIFAEVLNQIQQTLKTQIQEKNPTIRLDFEKEDILSVKSYVHSILYNLFSNALKYYSTKRKLIIDIRTKVVNQNTVYISISDNGLGIDLEINKADLFRPYTRFHPEIEGKGLGLHLVKAHIENMNGKIEVESEVDEGTTFHIYLPLQ